MGLTLCYSAPPQPQRLRPSGCPPARNFETADMAWLWAVAVLASRRESDARDVIPLSFPFDPADVVRCLEQLYRHRRIDLVHARILRIWGERQTVPDRRYQGEVSDHRIWREAMERLTGPLRAKGIVR